LENDPVSNAFDIYIEYASDKGEETEKWLAIGSKFYENEQLIVLYTEMKNYKWN